MVLNSFSVIHTHIYQQLSWFSKLPFSVSLLTYYCSTRRCSQVEVELWTSSATASQNQSILLVIMMPATRCWWVVLTVAINNLALVSFDLITVEGSGQVMCTSVQLYLYARRRFRGTKYAFRFQSFRSDKVDFEEKEVATE